MSDFLKRSLFVKKINSINYLPQVYIFLVNISYRAIKVHVKSNIAELVTYLHVQN